MSDLRTFAQDTAQTVMVPPFEDLVGLHRVRARRRTASLSVAAVLVVVAAVALLAGLTRVTAQRLPAVPSPSVTDLDVPSWRADEIVGHPDSFVVAQFESATDRKVTLTVWKRCVDPRPDNDCIGTEAMAVVDGTGHRLLALGAVTGSSTQPSLGDPGIFREVDDGIWYWAHQGPGPYLLSSSWRAPVPITVMDRPIKPNYGTGTVECADGVGSCILDVGTRTLERVDLPEIDGMRWASPTTCGFWGLAGAGGDLRLVIQQADDSFTTVDLSERATTTTQAEGGRNCEIAVYQSTSDNKVQLVVSLDRGRTWQVRDAPPPQTTQLYEEYPHLRILLPPQWATYPTTTSPIGLPGPLKAL